MNTNATTYAHIQTCLYVEQKYTYTHTHRATGLGAVKGSDGRMGKMGHFLRMLSKRFKRL
jgi:hypothetical protein